MEEKKNDVAIEFPQWVSPSVEIISVKNVTMGDGSFNSDTIEGS